MNVALTAAVIAKITFDISMAETKKAIDLSQKALRRRENAIQIEMDANRKLREEEEKTEKSILKLYNTKKGIISTSIKEFISVFNPISELSFLNLSTNQIMKNEIDLKENMIDIYESVRIYERPLTNNQKILSVLCGPMAIMYADIKQEEQALAYANQQMKAANLYEQAVESQILVLQGIAKENELLRDKLKELNVLLRSGIESSNNLIMKYGNNDNLYSDDDIKILRWTIQIADTIQKLSMSKLYNQKGELDENIQKILERSNEIFCNAVGRVEELIGG